MPDQTQQLVDALRARIADPGAFLPRRFADGMPAEGLASWRARAVAAGLADGNLGYVPASELDEYCDYGYPLGGKRPRIDWCGLKRGHAGLHIGGRGEPGFTNNGTVRRGTAPVPGSSRRAQEPKPGDRVEDGGIMGTLVRCRMCGGSGLLHQPDEMPETARPAPEPEPSDDEIAEEIDRAEEQAEIEEAGRELLDALRSVPLPFEANRAAYHFRVALGESGPAEPQAGERPCICWDGNPENYEGAQRDCPTHGEAGEAQASEPDPDAEQAVIRAAIDWHATLCKIGKWHPIDALAAASTAAAVLVAAVEALPPVSEPEPAAPKLAQGGLRG